MQILILYVICIYSCVLFCSIFDLVNLAALAVALSLRETVYKNFHFQGPGSGVA